MVLIKDFLWPLVIIFGAYRGAGKDKLLSLSDYLRRKGIRAYTCEEHASSHCPREEEESQKAYNKHASFYCVETCDIAIFVFFRGITIAVDTNLESLDQGPVIEFAHLCHLGRKIPLQLIFDSQSRAKSVSSIFSGLLQTSLCQEYVDQKVVERNSAEEVIEAIKRGVLGFCLSEYADYARRTVVEPIKLLRLFHLGKEEN